MGGHIHSLRHLPLFTICFGGKEIHESSSSSLKLLELHFNFVLLYTTLHPPEGVHIGSVGNLPTSGKLLPPKHLNRLFVLCPDNEKTPPSLVELLSASTPLPTMSTTFSVSPELPYHVSSNCIFQLRKFSSKHTMTSSICPTHSSTTSITTALDGI